MIQNVLNNVGGVGIYGVISICLFFAVFTGAILLTVFMKKSTVRKLGSLPLEGDEAVRSAKGLSHE